jgi:tetratricopeptide (TPR) repeat protein
MATTRGIRSLVSMGAAEEVRVLAELGRLDDAIARAEELDAEDDAQLRWSVVQRGLCLLDLSRLDTAEVERIANTPWSEPGDMRHVLGVALVRSGFAVQRGDAGSARELLVQLGSWQPFIDRDGAPELFPTLMRIARTAGASDVVMPILALPDNGTPLRGHLRRHLAGMGYCLSGDDAKAITCLRSALKGWVGFGASYEAAYAQAELGDALARLGDDEAESVRLQAAARFAAIGLPARPWNLPT